MVPSVLGALLLLLYGIIPTLEPAHLGRVHAACGGVFAMLSLRWWVDGHGPDVPEMVWSALCVIGVAVIVYCGREPREEALLRARGPARCHAATVPTTPG